MVDFVLHTTAPLDAEGSVVAHFGYSCIKLSPSVKLPTARVYSAVVYQLPDFVAPPIMSIPCIGLHAPKRDALYSWWNFLCIGKKLKSALFLGTFRYCWTEMSLHFNASLFDLTD